jgi:hypothetical protein
MKTITSIHTQESYSVIYFQDGDYRANTTIPNSALTAEQATTRQAAMNWFMEQVRPGETIVGPIILDIHRNKIMVDAGDPEATPPVPPTYRNQVVGVVTVQNQIGQRLVWSSSEDMPADLRDSFLALLAEIEDQLNQPQPES